MIHILREDNKQGDSQYDLAKDRFEFEKDKFEYERNPYKQLDKDDYVDTSIKTSPGESIESRFNKSVCH